VGDGGPPGGRMSALEDFLERAFGEAHCHRTTGHAEPRRCIDGWRGEIATKSPGEAGFRC